MRASGFTLIEVLVALAIIAIALGAMLRAGNSAIGHGEDLRQRQLASWIAENRLAEHRILKDWPELGVQTGEIALGGRQFLWRETTVETPNRQFRRLEIRVFAINDSEHAWANRFAYLTRPK